MSPEGDSAESWWESIDASVLDALAQARGALTLGELALRAGISEDAVRSVVAMLAEAGKVRIAAVELASRPPLAVAPPRQRTDAMPGEAPIERRATP